LEREREKDIVRSFISNKKKERGGNFTSWERRQEPRHGLVGKFNKRASEQDHYAAITVKRVGKGSAHSQGEARGEDVAPSQRDKKEKKGVLEVRLVRIETAKSIN